MELLVTKYEMPLSSGPLVHRPRLVERFDEALRSRLAIVAAAAGSGKTTLAVDWRRSAHGQGRPLAWLALEERDDEPRRFWSYVLGALGELGITDVPELPDRFDVRTDEAAEPFLNAVLNRLAAGPEDSVIVLDDVHHLTDPVVLGGLEYVIRHLPRRTHLALLTRRQPTLALDTLRLRSSLDEIDGRDLRFADDELEELFRQVAGFELEPEQTYRIQAATEGWAAALKLAALALRRSGDLVDLLAGLEAGTPQFLSEFLVNEVLERQDPDLRMFLLESAVLGSFTVAMCDEITGRTDTADLAGRVRDEHLFLQRLDRDGGTYRYHPLFAVVVRRHLAARDAERVRSIDSNASRWFEAAGDIDQAVRHAHLAGDDERVVELVLGNSADMVGIRGAREAVEDWAAIIRSSDDGPPGRGLAGAACTLAIAGRPIEAAALLDELPPADELDDTLAPLAFFTRTFIAFEEGEFERILELTERPVPWPVDEHFGVHLQRLAFEQRGRTLMLLDQDDVARVVLHQALTLQGPPHDPTYVIIPALLAQLDARAGRLSSAERWAEMSLQRAVETGNRDAPVTSEAWSARAVVALERGDLDTAAECAVRARQFADRMAVHPWAACLGLLCEARVFAARGMDDESSRALTMASDTHPFGQLPVVMRHLIAREAVDQAVRREDVAAISRWTAELAADHALGPARRIATSIHLDGPLAAAALADEIYARLDHRVTRRTRLEVCLAAALAFEGAGRHDHAVNAVGRAIEEAEPEGMIEAFRAAGPVIGGLVADVAALGRAVTRASPRFIEQLTDVATRDADGSSEPTPGATGQLSDREMSVLRMLRSALSLPEIAGELHVSHNTVKTHVQNIYRKLGTRTRTETVERARSKGLIT